MKAEDAELLIQGYRPGKATDSRTQKAVEYAEGHDTLRVQLAEQRQFDEHIGEVIHYIQPPEDLRQKLAALSGKTARKPGSLWQMAILPVLAGVLVLVAIAIFFSMQNSTQFAGRETVERMIEGTVKLSGVELETVATPAGQLGDWFYMRGFEGYAVPPELAVLPAVGSRVVQLDGHTIAQVAVDRRQLVVHIFDAAKFGVGLEANGPWRVFTHEGWAAAVRRHGANGCLITFRGSAEEMEEFLATLKKP
jgi:hypothetical protein